MIALYTPQNEVELSLLKGILDTGRVAYFVRNDRFGSMEIGPVIPLVNAKCIMVDEKDFERARTLLKGFLDAPRRRRRRRKYSAFDKARMVVETLLFGWIVPGRVRRRWTISAIAPRKRQRSSDLRAPGEVSDS